jgi:hypothetical protein
VAAKAQQQKAAAASAAGNNSPFQPSAESATYSAVITADGHGPLVVPDLPNSGRYRSSGPNKDYVAKLVLDRKLVKPGDDLHVTGGGRKAAAGGHVSAVSCCSALMKAARDGQGRAATPTIFLCSCQGVVMSSYMHTRLRLTVPLPCCLPLLTCPDYSLHPAQGGLPAESGTGPAISRAAGQPWI